MLSENAAKGREFIFKINSHTQTFQNSRSVGEMSRTSTVLLKNKIGVCVLACVYECIFKFCVCRGVDVVILPAAVMLIAVQVVVRHL